MSCAKVFHIFSAEQTITRNIWPTVGLYSGLPSAPPAHSMHRAKRAAPAPAPTQGSRGMAGVVLGQLREQGALRRPVPEDPPAQPTLTHTVSEGTLRGGSQADVACGRGVQPESYRALWVRGWEHKTQTAALVPCSATALVLCAVFALRSEVTCPQVKKAASHGGEELPSEAKQIASCQ